MKKNMPLIVSMFITLTTCGLTFGQALLCRFEKSLGTETATYQETVAFYQQLDKTYTKIFLKEMGPTDAGYNLHLVLFSQDAKFDPKQWHAQGKVVVLVNNGIHPGEPDGIDASMMFLRDLANGKITAPNNVVFAVIPVYKYWRLFKSWNH